jgi:GT2 family glycosyltransferase
VRFTILAAPGSDPGEARARATTVIDVAQPAELAAAARAASDPYLLVLAAGARPLSGAFGGLRAALEGGANVVGGATHTEIWRHYGWMLAPAPTSPLPFEAIAIVVPHGEAGAEAHLRGPIDVPARGMLLAERELLLEPLPAEPLAALVELGARARAAGGKVVCLPAFACTAPAEDNDDRGRLTALRALADVRPELVGHARLPVGVRRRIVEREVRFDGGLRRRLRIPLPPLTVLIHGAGAERAARRARDLPAAVAARAVADPAEALRAELRVRGDRNVLVTDAAHLPEADALADLVERLEDAPFFAAVAPDAAGLRGDCVLLSAGRFPADLQPTGTSLEAALGSLLGGAEAIGRAVRAPGHQAADRPARALRAVRVVFLAASSPEILRTSLDAAVATLRSGDEFVAVCAAAHHTARGILETNPLVRIELDSADPLLADGANRALVDAPGLVFLIADDVLVTTSTLDRLRSAFARIPALGAALPAVPAAAGGEGVHGVNYADLAEMRLLAERRERDLPRDCTPIDLAVTPAIAIAREALDAVGGIDPEFGPTQRGIADLVARIRAAGYTVVRCDDTLVHRFDVAASHNPASAANAQQPLVAAPDRATIARGFDPARRVPLVRPARAATVTISQGIVLPVGDEPELERALAYLSAAATAFSVADPVCVYVVLDGALPIAPAAARIRASLAAGGRPLAESVTVRLERSLDLAGWREQIEPGLRLVTAAGYPRAALDGLDQVAASALGTLLRTAR